MSCIAIPPGVVAMRTAEQQARVHARAAVHLVKITNEGQTPPGYRDRWKASEGMRAGITPADLVAWRWAKALAAAWEEEADRRTA